MALVSTYLEFKGKTEEAFSFYKSVFKSDYEGDVMRWGDMPPSEEWPPLSDKQKNLIMHVTLPILGGHLLLGTDDLEMVGTEFRMGNNVQIVLSPDTRKHTHELFNKLSEGGKVTMALEDMFWGDLFGTCVDKFGICWMFNCDEKTNS